MTYEREPDWPTGTDLKIVFDWMYPRYCTYCFQGVCDWCEEFRVQDGVPCHCTELHEHEYGSIE